MPDIVIDSSVGASWAMPDEASPVANLALELLEGATMLVPALFWYELANVLWTNERRGRIAPQTAAIAISKIAELRHHSDAPTPRLTNTMKLAKDFNLTVYDASYLDLAFRAGAALATLDKRLNAAAIALGVETLSPQLAHERQDTDLTR